MKDGTVGKMKNPNFGIWGEEADYSGGKIDEPLIYGRTYVLPYKERLKYMPRDATVGKVNFRNIVYPTSKKTYDTILKLARETRDSVKSAYRNPYLYPLPPWFDERPARKKYVTLFYYLVAKGLQDSGKLK